MWASWPATVACSRSPASSAISLLKRQLKSQLRASVESAEGPDRGSAGGDERSSLPLAPPRPRVDPDDDGLATRHGRLEHGAFLVVDQDPTNSQIGTQLPPKAVDGAERDMPAGPVTSSTSEVSV